MTEDTKESRIIRAKIETRKGQMKNTGQTFSVFLVVMGVILLFFNPVVGLLLLTGGIMISVYNSRKKERLQGEVRELEAEL